MDPFALRAANLVAGNRDEVAGLEFTIAGPALESTESAVIAIAGAEFDPELDGRPVPAGEAFLVPSGSVLRLGRARAGCRGYLAIRGGIDVPLVLGSRSTYAPGGFGGLNGRPLAARDYVRATKVSGEAALRRTRVRPATREPIVRAVPGPQDERFDAEAFWSEPYRVSTRSDRTGIRLEGGPVVAEVPSDIDPEGLVTGAIQVPGDGMPIVLGPDHPATGGYAKIATVITADLDLIAQARPGDTLRFVAVDVERARAALREREEELAASIQELA